MSSEFKLKPIDLISLSLLIEFQSIKLRIHDRKLEELNSTSTHLQPILNQFQLIQSILLVSTILIFNQSSTSPASITQVYALLRLHLHHLNSSSVHQLITSINQILNFAITGNLHGIYDFFNRLSTLIAPPAPDANPDRAVEFNLESPLGLFIRRCKLTFANLEFDDVASLSNQLKEFCTDVEPRLDLHPNPSSTPPLDSISLAYLQFTDVYAPDFNRNASALRRFYDTRGNSAVIKDISNAHIPGSIHSQALLSLAHLHYLNDALPAAYDALEESTRLARLAGDRMVVDRCTCLRRRLDHQVSLHEQSDHSISNPSTLVDSVLPLAGPAQAQAGLEALRNLSETEEKLKQASHASSGGLASERQFWDANEELFSALKALDGSEPLNRVYAKLFRAKRMTLPSSLGANDPPPLDRFDHLSWFGLQAKTWYLQGQPDLCVIYEDLALALSDEDDYQDLDDRPKLMSKTTVLCERAIRIAHQGDFAMALLVLMEEAKKNTGCAKSFERLHHTVFDVLEMKARHENDQEGLYQIKTNRFKLVLAEADEESSVRKQIEELYEQGQKMKDAGHPSLALCPILRGITLSSKMNLKTDEAIGVTMWADAMIYCEPVEAGRWALEKMEKEIRLFENEGLKDRAKAFAEALLVRARCEIMAGLGLRGDGRLEKVLDLLKMAEKYYCKAEAKDEALVCEAYQITVIKEAMERMGYKSEELLSKNVEDDDDEEEKKKKKKKKKIMSLEDWLKDWKQRKHQPKPTEDLQESLFQRIVNALASLSADRYGVGR